MLLRRFRLTLLHSPLSFTLLHSYSLIVRLSHTQAHSHLDSLISILKLTHTQTDAQKHSYSDSLLLRLIIPWSAQTQTDSHSDCLTSIPTHIRLTRTQIHSHSHFLTLRPTQAQTHSCSDSSCSDPLNHRLAHTQTRSHSDQLTLRRTRAHIYTHTHSNSGSLALKSTHTQNPSLSDLRLARTHTCRLWECLERKVRPRTHAPIDRYP